MKELLLYLIKVNVGFTLLYLLYWACYRRFTFFAFNRAYLLGMIPVALLLPLFSMPEARVPGEWIASLTEITVGAENRPQGGSIFSVWSLLFWSYVAGSTFFLLRFASNLFRLMAVIRKWEKRPGNSYTQLLTSPDYPTFSFFRYLHFHSSDHAHQAVIEAHEQVHIRQWHSLDNICYELFSAFCWFNPAVHKACSSLKNVHEFLADEAVIEAKMNKRNYSELLLSKATGMREIRLVTAFFQKSNLKNRVKMMKLEKSNGKYRFSYMGVLPLLLFLFIANACTEPLGEPASDPGATVSQDATMEDEVYSQVEQMPVFGKDDKALINYLVEELTYPENAKKAGVEGVVYVEFIVDNQGDVINVNVQRGVNPELDAEAVRVVREMPPWEPGRKDGKAVSVKYVLPIKFTLS